MEISLSESTTNIDELMMPEHVGTFTLLQGDIGESFEDTELPVLTQYNMSDFANRLSAMAQRTMGYAGALETAWDTAEMLDSSEVAPQRDNELTNNERQQVEILVTRMKNAGITNAVIEAAHVYAYEDLSDPLLEQSLAVQSKVARIVSSRLESEGIKTKQVLFYDDYNPDPSGRGTHELDVDQLVDFVRSHGLAPDMLIREGAMEALSHAVISQMRRQGLVTETTSPGDDTKVESYNLSYRNYELYRHADDMVSCAMLDTALSLVKLTFMGDGVVNILPRMNPDGSFGYRNQQKKMRTILGQHLSARVTPVFNVFTNQNTESLIPISTGSHHALRKAR